jgi:exopolysaccharide biosynthesis polyprenyl glycosylphosphotransferase
LLQGRVRNGRPYKVTDRQPWLRIKLIRVSDTFVVLSVLLGVFLLTNVGRMPDGFRGFLALRVTVKNVVFLVVFVLAWRVLARLTRIYVWQIVRERAAERKRVALTTGLLSLIALFFPTVSVTHAFGYTAIGYFWLGSTLAILGLRRIVHGLVPLPEGRRPKDTLIVGTGPRAQRLSQELVALGADDFRIVGYVDHADFRPASQDGVPYLGTPDVLEGILMRSAVDEVLITLPIKSAYTEIQEILECCRRVGVRAQYLADLFDPVHGRPARMGDRPSLVQAPPAPEGWALVSKRLIDLVSATVITVVLCPILVGAALAVRLSGPGPILFGQDRYGYNRRLFRMYKFRTMVADAEMLQVELESRNEASGPVFKIRQDPRITRVGRFLRRTSIDELPQLFSVIRGDMSLVGPRPLPVRDVHRFTEGALMRRFSVRPGLTCLWQIGGRNNVGFDEWIRLDLKYIDEWSLLLDLIILIRTVPAVVRGTGAS